MVTTDVRVFRRAAVVAALVLAVVVSARGQGAFFEYLSPRPLPDGVRLRLDTRFDSTVDVEDQPTDLGFMSYDLRLASALKEGAGDREWQFTGRAGYENLDTDAVLPDSGGPLPTELWNLNVGTMYRRFLDPGRIIGGAASIGSASDEPFQSMDETELQAALFYRLPARERDAWLFTLIYSNTRTFLRDIPIPGVAYQYASRPDLFALIGIPAFVRYQPVDRLTLRAFYLPARTVQAAVEYAVSDRSDLYVEFDWDERGYFRADRDERREALFFYEKRAAAGYRFEVTEATSIDIAAGYVFDRFLFEGEDYDDRDNNRIDFDDGTFAQLQLNIQF